MKNPSLILLLLFTLVLGCKTPDYHELTYIAVSKEINDPIPLDQFAIENKVIPLETKKNILLGLIIDVIVYEDKLFVNDLKKVAVFDFNGNFISVLGNQGIGPGEYSSVNSFTIDRETGDIYLSTYNKLLVFDSTFELKEERKLGYPIGYVRVLNGKLWIVSEEIGVSVGDQIANRTFIYGLDENFQVSDTIPFRTIIMDKKRIGGYAYRHWVSDLDDGDFIFMPVLTPENLMRDTLYHIENNSIKPSVRFEFERMQSLDERNYQTLLLYNIVNSESYYILEYDQDWKRYMFLYDKKNQRGYNLSEGLIDDEGDPVFLRPLDLNQDLFYYIKKSEFEDKTIEELNPLIGIVKLK